MNHQYAFIRSIFQVRFSLLLILVLPALQTFAQDKEVEQTFYFTGNTGDAPNATTTSTLAFEDLWPSQGDYDYNDDHDAFK